MMTPIEQANGPVDQLAATADNAIKSTQRVTNAALDSLAGSVHDMRELAAPALQRSSEQLSALAQRGLNAVTDSAHQVRDRALRASDTTLGYIKDEPVKAMLIAAATGAALMALIGLLTRSRERA